MTGDGSRLLALVDRLAAQDIRRMVLFMRHSAREFSREVHDLENPLTDEGREMAVRFGQQLPSSLPIKGYASPAQRCLDTASCIIRGQGGATGKRAYRELEALGMFYALDQVRMWKGMMDHAEGMPGFLKQWFAGALSPDTMIPAQDAARLITRVLVEKYRQQPEDGRLEVCVSHDMTVYLMRAQMLGMDPDSHEVPFLDGLVVYDNGSHLIMECATGAQVKLS